MAMKPSDKNGVLTDINMTPLIDVMLVLLIIFIISLPPFTHAVKIDNPMPTKDQLPSPPQAVEATALDRVFTYVGGRAPI